MNVGGAACVLVLYLLMTLASLAINRRALMVSALLYVLAAFTNLLGQSGVVYLNLAVTALAIGAALLLLSAFWQSARKLIVTRFPEVVRKRLPPVQ